MNKMRKRPAAQISQCLPSAVELNPRPIEKSRQNVRMSLIGGNRFRLPLGLQSGRVHGQQRKKKKFHPTKSPDKAREREEVVTVDNNVCTAPIKADKVILEYVQSSRIIIDADSDGKNEMNNTTPITMSFEIRNMKVCSVI
ncbi:hypothetical protein TNCV_1739531 [Trichonephila clavipes]|nr:hypothetical protein TNCV_1739531 [Trichonephila clavipes]